MADEDLRNWIPGNTVSPVSTDEIVSLISMQCSNQIFNQYTTETVPNTEDFRPDTKTKTPKQPDLLSDLVDDIFDLEEEYRYGGKYGGCTTAVQNTNMLLDRNMQQNVTVKASQESGTEFETFNTIGTSASEALIALNKYDQQKNEKGVGDVCMEPLDIGVLLREEAHQPDVVITHQAESSNRQSEVPTTPEKLMNFFASRGKVLKPFVGFTSNPNNCPTNFVSKSELERAVKELNINTPVHVFTARSLGTASNSLRTSPGETVLSDSLLGQGHCQQMPESQSRSKYVVNPMRRKVFSVSTRSMCGNPTPDILSSSPNIVKDTPLPGIGSFSTPGHMRISPSQQSPSLGLSLPKQHDNGHTCYTEAKESTHALKTSIKEFPEPETKFETFNTIDTWASDALVRLNKYNKQNNEQGVGDVCMQPLNIKGPLRVLTHQYEVENTLPAESSNRQSEVPNTPEKLMNVFASRGKVLKPDLECNPQSKLEQAIEDPNTDAPVHEFTAGNLSTTLNPLNITRSGTVLDSHLVQGKWQQMAGSQPRSKHVAVPICSKVPSVLAREIPGNPSHVRIKNSRTPVICSATTPALIRIPPSRQAPAYRLILPKPCDTDQTSYTEDEVLKQALQDSIKTRPQNQCPTNHTDHGERFHPYQRPSTFQTSLPNLPEFK